MPLMKIVSGGSSDTTLSSKNFKISLAMSYPKKEFEQKAAESVYVIQNQLKHIAYFYEGFADLYNAIKHGDRATPFGYAELRRVPDTEEDDEAKEPVATSYQYVLFLCRRHMQQGVYLTNAPIEYLMDVMWPAVDVTHQLFAHLRKVMIADLRGDSDKIPFYAVTTFKRSKKLKENSSRWIVMQNNETKQVLKQPEDGITKEMLVSQGAGKGVIAGRFARDSGQLAIRVNPEAKVCQDYPLEITLTDKGMVGLTMRRQADYKIEIRFEEMDLTQYRILQDLDEESNDGRIDSVTLINDSTNQEIKTKTQVPFHLPEIPDFLDDDLLEFLEGKQRALTQSIPVPVIRLSQAQRELMTEYRSKTSIEQEDIEEMFEKLEELGQKRKFTEIIVEKVMPSGRVLRSQSVGEVPWQINTPAEMGWIDEDEMNIPEEGDYHIRKVVSDYPYSDQKLVALLENPDNNTLDIVTNILDRDGDLFSPNYADLAIEYRYGEDRFWHSKHTLWLKRRHLVECPLCEDIVDDSLEQHLSDDCTPDIIV